MNKGVIILGAGPAGLAVAEAMATERVRVFDIYTAGMPSNLTEPKKSDLYGAQFLHGPLHGSRVKHSEPFDVTYRLQGTPNGYARKVYGEGHTMGSSADKYPDGHRMLGWDIREAYDHLWHLWYAYMHTARFTPASMRDTITEVQRHGDVRIISTIPRRLLCKAPDKHVFHSRKVWAIGESDIGPVLQGPDNTIKMNGERNPSWYRAAKIQGHTTVEWPDGPRPPIEGVVPVEKPLSTTCDCWSDDVVFLGRYGAWEKQQLVHQVYDASRDYGAGLRVA